MSGQPGTLTDQKKSPADTKKVRSRVPGLWYDNGQKKYVMHLQNSKKHGLYTEWNKDGRLTKDIDYDMGIPISEYIVEYDGDSYVEINRRNSQLSVRG